MLLFLSAPCHVCLIRRLQAPGRLIVTTAAALKASVCQKIDEQSERIIGVGERIMDDPELGFKEHRTADKVQEVFSELGLEFDSGLGLTGVKAVLRGGRPGPTVALMGELDALQVPGHPRANEDTQAAHALSLIHISEPTRPY